ncbi:MAG: DUF1573 domain-containing protein [Alistipes sp.]|nr:DUF1573 domain-containing protein [Alistipes sp.]
MRLIPYIKIVFLLLSCSLSCVARAQNPTQSLLKFEQVEWNFGDVAEDGGKIEHTFTFVNNTSKPVVILDVTTGCGCTTSSYSRKPILRGERGEVTVVFDPMNLPGRVTKSASILTSASSKPFVVTLQGNVIPRKKSVQELYPIDLGEGVRLEINSHDFAYVGRGEVVEQTIGWVNTSSRSATLKLLPKQSSGLLQVQAPATLRAGERGVITLRYAIDKNSTRYGTLNDMYGFTVNGREARAVLSTTAIAVDHFDRMAEDISLPSGELSKKIIKFGDVKRGKTLTDATLVIANDGGSDLVIRAVEWGSQALKCSLQEGDKVKAGGRLTLQVSFDSSNCDYGVWVDRLKIITNDPVRPMHTIRTTAIVVD